MHLQAVLQVQNHIYVSVHFQGQLNDLSKIDQYIIGTLGC